MGNRSVNIVLISLEKSTDKQEVVDEHTSILPLCASMICLAIAKPRPVPLDLYVTKGSKIVSNFSDVIPHPVSDIVIII